MTIWKQSFSLEELIDYWRERGCEVRFCEAEHAPIRAEIVPPSGDFVAGDGRSELAALASASLWAWGHTELGRLRTGRDLVGGDGGC